jgi:hypothetical protein
MNGALGDNTLTSRMSPVKAQLAQSAVGLGSGYFASHSLAIGQPPPSALTSTASSVTAGGATLNGTVNPAGQTVTDCHFDWGTSTAYGNSAACSPMPGSGTNPVAISAALSGLVPDTTYHFRIVATSAAGTSVGSDATFTTSASGGGGGSAGGGSGTSRAVAVTSSPVVLSSTAAAFAGTVNPAGLATVAYFQYGLDASYGAASDGPTYTNSTAAQQIGAGFSAVSVSASVSGLVPNAVYHVRLVATNSAGTTYGPDQTFKTKQDPPPPPPTLGRADVKPTGQVFVVENGILVPLTEARQLPSGTVVDALHGSVTVTAATGVKRKTDTGVFGGAIFRLTQVRTGASKGLTTLSIVENAFPGAPSFAACKVARAADSAQTASLSSKVLQTLRASAHGRFRTSGRYAAATVRGTIWTISDRCNGTLTTVQKDTVLVTDFVRHTVIVLRTGQSYLARATRS